MYRKNDKIRRVKKIIIFAVCFIFVSGFGCSNLTARELTFHQALERMVNKNETLKAFGSVVDKSEHLMKATRGLYYPKIWVDGKHTRMDDEILIDLNDIRLVMGTLHGINPYILPSFETRVQDSSFSTANINLSWMIFAGGKILAANGAADARVIESKEQFLYAKSILTTELAKRYYGYLFSMEAVGVYEQMLNGIEQHLNQARKLEKSGMLAQSERIHAEAAHAEALRKYKKSVRKTEIVQSGLKNTLSSEEIIAPVSPLFLTKKILPLGEYLDNAKRKNHLLKKLAAKKNRRPRGLEQKSAHICQRFISLGNTSYTKTI